MWMNSAFSMLYHDGTSTNAFTEEGKPDYGLGTWYTWKMVKMIKDYYHHVYNQMEYEMKHQDKMDHSQ